MLWLFLFPLTLFAYPGEPLKRTGDEIMVAGQLFHTETPVILWTDPGGYDGYRVERRFVSYDHSSWETSQKENKELKTPNRFGLRNDGLTPIQQEAVRGGGWDLNTLKKSIDQLVLHYDTCGLSQLCFQTLHDKRGLSIHFMIDLDGTIYQTLDVKERAWHASKANGRSIGIEIAHIGAYAANDLTTLNRWYKKDPHDRVTLTIPPEVLHTGLRTTQFKPIPARNQLIKGDIHNKTYFMYDFTQEQYNALIKLSATLCNIFPQIKCTYPRNHQGYLLTTALTPYQFTHFKGILGHYHIQTNKIDPGPAFQWDTLLNGIKKHLRS
ncbi:MAG: N-acetylmuramoyl-L-alanine amidase [Chlamydiia bacterium]|nr:N-acetylmuramoyl-L-alanine amidase [Chlamydiia bacterium]